MAGAREARSRSMIDLLADAARHGGRWTPTCSARVCGDLRISEIVDMPNWVVSLLLPARSSSSDRRALARATAGAAAWVLDGSRARGRTTSATEAGPRRRSSATSSSDLRLGLRAARSWASPAKAARGKIDDRPGDHAAAARAAGAHAPGGDPVRRPRPPALGEPRCAACVASAIAMIFQEPMTSLNPVLTSAASSPRRSRRTRPRRAARRASAPRAAAAVRIPERRAPADAVSARAVRAACASG